MEGMGLPNLNLIKHWTLVGLNCYLFLSLNFVGVFAQEAPRLTNHQQSWGQNHGFRASPFDSSSREPHVEPVRHSPRYLAQPRPFGTKLQNILPPPPSIEKADTIDLSKIPSVKAASSSKLVENSIDRFDAYGDYEYVDADQYPKQIQYHKPLRHRPDGPEPHFVSHHKRPQQPQRRVDYNRRPIHPPHHKHPYQPQFRPVEVYSRPRPPPYGPPAKTSFLSNLFGFGDKNDNLPPSFPNYEDPSDDGGIFDPLLSLVGLKDSETSEFRPPESNHLQQYHDPFEYDYGDYLEGYQNYAKPQRPKTVPERIARWFTGFKIPRRNKKILPRFERVESQQNGVDYAQYDTGDDENLIFYNNQQRPGGSLGKPKPTASLYDFGDVVQAIRNNETSALVIKKFLSAAAALSERSDSNPVFMMWTIPTTILALLGVVYFVGALSIIGYKYTLQDGQGDPGTLITVGAVFAIPLILGFIFVASRSAVNGELAVNKIVRGDLRGSMRQDFDGVDFVMDAIFGSSALLGIGWLVSITI